MTTDLPRPVLPELDDLLTAPVRRDYPLSRCGTYRIGGAARAVVTPRTPEEIATVIRVATEHGLPWLAVGLGSNLLFDDDGVDGVVLRIAKTLDGITINGSRWTVGAGAPTPTLARKSARAGAGGVHRLIGVPGAVGGGVYMNAGAHGQEFKDVVHSVDVVSPAGQLQTVHSREIAWAYRRSGLEGVILSTTLELPEEDPGVLGSELKRYLKHRRDGTPFDQPCCGSVFRNPPADQVGHVEIKAPATAGRLIEACGLKGYRVGGAEVSSMHANYIVNVGEATARDVRQVIADVVDAVQERFDVSLVREVKFVTANAEVR